MLEKTSVLKRLINNNCLQCIAAIIQKFINYLDKIKLIIFYIKLFLKYKSFFKKKHKYIFVKLFLIKITKFNLNKFSEIDSPVLQNMSQLLN